MSLPPFLEAHGMETELSLHMYSIYLAGSQILYILHYVYLGSYENPIVETRASFKLARCERNRHFLYP